MFGQLHIIIQNKPFCNYGQILAPWDSLVRTSYIPFLERGFREYALIMADIPIDGFAHLVTLVHRVLTNL